MERNWQNPLEMVTRQQAAFEICENLLAPGKKWRVSPYLPEAWPGPPNRIPLALVPVYQAVILDLLNEQRLPPKLSILDLGAPAGLGALAALDALLAWETACVLYDVPSGLDQVKLCLDGQHSPAYSECLQRFRQALLARAKQLPELPGLTRLAHWLKETATTRQILPNLVLCPFPWEQNEQGLADLLDHLPEGAIVAGLEWQRDGRKPELLRWRYELLQHRSDLVALGPCGAEYVRGLPGSCSTCFHGRFEALHCPEAGSDHTTPRWTYVLLLKQAISAEAPPEPLISANLLAQGELETVHLRYVGTLREKNPLANHPDTAVDDPNNQEWREYIKVCPGHSQASRVAIERRAAMQIPPLRYGQWLPLRQVRPQQPYASQPGVYILQARDETAFYSAAGLPVAETFLNVYSPAVRAAVDEAAYRLFGFPAMRDFQHTVLARVLTGGDILAIAATGGGKSECYILPAILLPGITVVVSPLKSLILDQYEQRIRDRYGLDHLTTFINGDVKVYERQGRLRRMVLGHYKLVYMTPEQLERSYVLEALRQANRQIGLRYLAMDEAHCISQWGHDFRPSYLNIVQRLRGYGLAPRRIALTATASPRVRDDVCDELHLNKAGLGQGGDVFIDSSNRPELNLVVHRVRRTEEKAQLIVEALRRLNGQGSAIVFMPHTGGTPDQPRDFGAPASASRPENAGMVSSGVSPFARYLQQQLNQTVAIYHGSLDNEVLTPDNDGVTGDEDAVDLDTITRQAEQRSFISDQKRIMVATKGFGMGIDKPDIRLVIHRSPPANLEAYAQEAGRAGRDQKLATVMLLYSDDQPQIAPVFANQYLGRTVLPSDRDIQQYFIDQKYVRREDVQAMLAFLRSDQSRQVNEALYFTNDQVMAAFDRYAAQPHLAGLEAAYTWPTFPPRKKTGVYESDDHKRILEQGYLYYQKQVHIGRILSVLFNTRPTIEGQIIPAVHMVHEIGTLLREFRLYRPEAIVASPAYFGQYLRQAGIDPADLGRLLPNGDRVDIMPLALRLGRSLRETVSMLQDIRYCEGRTGRNDHWQGALLNFWWVEAPRWVKISDAYTNLPAWRSYAGARKRARPASGQTGLDDYFPWRVLNTPLSWEVTPGPGLHHPDAPAYLNAFMTLHDQRQRNDQDNFAYLLDKYVGNGQGPRECLRSLLLGYLKTNEVVMGGNCYSCSVCVPNLKFERYSLAKRQQVIVRLLDETTTFMTQLEEHNRRTPTRELLQQLLAAIAAEDTAGRSGSAYFDSWLARLMQDDPEHQGALWVRLFAFEEGRLHLSPQDLLTIIDRLVQLTRARPDLARLQTIIERYRLDQNYRASYLSLTIQAARLAHRQEDWPAEAGLWQQVQEATHQARQKGSELSLRREALARLLDLYRPAGALADKQRAAQIGLELAHLPGIPFQAAQEAYGVVSNTWNWVELQTELSSSAPHPAAALLSWLEGPAEPQKPQAVLSWLEKNIELWQGWPIEALQSLAKKLEVDLDKAPKILLALADVLMQKLAEPALATQYLLRAWAAGAELSLGRLKWIGEYLTHLDVAWGKKVFVARVERTASLVSALQQLSGQKDFPPNWLPYFPREVLARLPDEALVPLLETAVKQNDRPDQALLNLFAHKLNQKDGDLWLAMATRLASQQATLSVQLLQACLSLKDLRRETVQALFPFLLQDRSAPAAVRDVLNALTFRFELVKGQDLLALCVDNWQAFLIHKQELPFLKDYRIEGSTLVRFVAKWLAYQDKPHRLDMIIIILRNVRSRSRSTWLTPVSLEFQALCAAGRFTEAEKLMAGYADLKIEGQSAPVYLKSARAQNPARQPVYEAEFKRLWELTSKS